MTFFARHIPGLAIITSLIICLFLIVMWHQKAFHRALIVPPIASDVADISRLIAAYHTCAKTPWLTRLLSEAEALAPRQPIRDLAFGILLAFTSQEKRVAAYLHHAAFGPVRGIKRAAPYHFGIPHSKLTVGEILLLCDIAQGAILPVNDPIAALHRRDALLSDLYTRGFLSPDVYLRERNRALSLSTNHQPVN